MTTTYHAGSIIAVTINEDGYNVTQVENTSISASDALRNIGTEKVVPVDYNRFPVEVKGTYQTTFKLLIIDVEVLGNKLGPTIPWNFIAGPLKIPLDLKVAKGLITIYLKTDHECWIKYLITAKTGGLKFEHEELMFEY